MGPQLMGISNFIESVGGCLLLDLCINGKRQATEGNQSEIPSEKRDTKKKKKKIGFNVDAIIKWI